MRALDDIGVMPKVLEILEENPDLTYSFIAEELGVTREWVRQIAQRNGYPSRKGVLKPKVCLICGETFYKRNSLYCSPDCGNTAKRRRVIVNCSRCGKPMERTRSTMRNKSGRYYCSRVCYAGRE